MDSLGLSRGVLEIPFALIKPLNPPFKGTRDCLKAKSSFEDSSALRIRMGFVLELEELSPNLLFLHNHHQNSAETAEF